MKRIIIAAITFILLLLLCTMSFGQFTYIRDVPGVATDIYFDNNDCYITLKDGRLFKNFELYDTYPTNTTNEMGLLSVCKHNGEIVVSVSSTNGRYQNVYMGENLLLSVDYFNPTTGAYATNHRGGEVLSYDGELFVSFGMGTFGYYSQDDTDYRGKIVQLKPIEQIVVKGLRNPWRFDYDGVNFWIADVGQNLREEISLIENFGIPNLGWPYYEGTFEHYDTTGMIPPLYQYAHNGEHRSITGGVIYNDSYFFCDFLTGDGGRLYPDGGLETIEFPENVTSMDIRNDTLFVVTYNGDVFAKSLGIVLSIDEEYEAEELNPPYIQSQSDMFNLMGQPIRPTESYLYVQDKKLMYLIP